MTLAFVRGKREIKIAEGPQVSHSSALCSSAPSWLLLPAAETVMSAISPLSSRSTSDDGDLVVITGSDKALSPPASFEGELLHDPLRRSAGPTAVGRVDVAHGHFGSFPGLAALLQEALPPGLDSRHGSSPTSAFRLAGMDALSLCSCHILAALDGSSSECRASRPAASPSALGPAVPFVKEALKGSISIRRHIPLLVSRDLGLVVTYHNQREGWAELHLLLSVGARATITSSPSWPSPSSHPYGPSGSSVGDHLQTASTSFWWDGLDQYCRCG